jgi:hypothetical protein
LAGTTFVVGIGQSNPQKNLIALNRLLEVSRMSGQQPMAESIFQARRARSEPFGKTVGERPQRTADQLAIVWKYKLLNTHRLLERWDNGLFRKEALQSKTIEAGECEAAKMQVMQPIAQLLPRVERADRETKVGEFGQGHRPRQRRDEIGESIRQDSSLRFDLDQ